MDTSKAAPPRHRFHRTTTARALRRTAVAVAAAVTLATLIAPRSAAAGITPVGSGSYTTDAVGPGPSGCGTAGENPRQYLTSDAPKGAIPTNDWWSSLIFKRLDCNYSEVLTADPATFKAQKSGLGISYPTKVTITGTATGVSEYHYAYAEDLVAGVAGLAAPTVKVAGWTDWTVTPDWSDGSHTLRATIGHGLPITSFVATGGAAQVAATDAVEVWWRSGAMVGVRVNSHDYLLSAPGGSWTLSGTTLTSPLNSAGRYSVAVLPTTSATSVSDRQAVAQDFAASMDRPVTNTVATPSYDAASSTVTVKYGVTAGNGGTVVALFPHQASQLQGSASSYTYVSPRGPMKVLLNSSGFSTRDTFTGILPAIPGVATSSGSAKAQLVTLLQQAQADQAPLKADTYWTGKALGRAAQIVELADQIGETTVRDQAIGFIRSTLTNWFTASPGKTEQVFSYNGTWGTLIGYPASYGSDQELNDHHFHYGYYIAAAATLARFDRTWVSKYGGMVNLLIRDANSYDRSDSLFPYLRDFDIYAGNDWASGHGAFAAGNNQESSSEGMNFDAAVVRWGETTGQTEIRDTGIYLYTTQARAIRDYWWNGSGGFPSSFGHPVVGMVWGDGGSYATWFSAQPEMIQGINTLPLTGGHLYLGAMKDLLAKGFSHLNSLVGKPTAWQDILTEALALTDPAQAKANYDADHSYKPEEGESPAHTYQWVQNLAALGTLDSSVTADHPIAATFVLNGKRTYVASNLTGAPITVKFSTGVSLTVPAGQTMTTGAQTWTGGSALPGTTPSSSPSATPTGTPSSTPSSTPTGNPTSNPTSTVTVTATATATVTVTTTACPNPSSTSSGGGSSGSTGSFYLSGNGALSGSSASTSWATLNSADGANRADAPYHPLTFVASGVNGKVTAPARFDLGVDAGTQVGLAVAVRVSYDATGDGTVDRTETYTYFATDPVPGAEHYTQAAGITSATGALPTMSNGKVTVEVWSVLGTGRPTVALGSSSVSLTLS